jgi:hypothetical protein
MLSERVGPEMGRTMSIFHHGTNRTHEAPPSQSKIINTTVSNANGDIPRMFL